MNLTITRCTGKTVIEVAGDEATYKSTLCKVVMNLMVVGSSCFCTWWCESSSFCTSCPTVSSNKKMAWVVGILEQICRLVEAVPLIDGGDGCAGGGQV